MTDILHRYPASVMAGKPWLGADDVLLLRRHVYPRGLACLDDARQLRRLHRSASGRDAAWNVWFVETIAAYFVHACGPRGRIDEAKAQDIAALFCRKGRIADAAELEAVLHMIELAERSSHQLTILALEQLCLAVEGRGGAYAESRMGKRQGIGAEDVAYLQRVLRRACWTGHVMLTAGEIAVLDRIDRAVAGAANNPGWRYLLCSVVECDADDEERDVPWLHLPADAAILSAAA